MADRSIQETNDVAANRGKIGQLRDDLEAQVENYNTKIAGGKWNDIMPGLATGKDLTRWSSQVRWPWGEPTNMPPVFHPQVAGRIWRDAATADGQSSSEFARWKVIEGLGPSGRAMAVMPASLDSSWSENATNAPTLQFDFKCQSGDAEAFVDFLPAFRIVPGMKLRVAVCVDDGAPRPVEVPGSSGAQDENGPIRSAAVQDNYTRARIPLPGLAAGKHILRIRAVDPGVVIDQVSLP